MVQSFVLPVSAFHSDTLRPSKEGPFCVMICTPHLLIYARHLHPHSWPKLFGFSFS